MQVQPSLIDAGNTAAKACDGNWLHGAKVFY